jgi:hypothetical protein
VSAWITATTFESSKRKNHYEKGIIIHHPGGFVHAVHAAARGQTTVICRSHYHILGEVKNSLRLALLPSLYRRNASTDLAGNREDSFSASSGGWMH